MRYRRSGALAVACTLAIAAFAGCGTQESNESTGAASGSEAKSAAELEGTVYYMIPLASGAPRFEKYDAKYLREAFAELAPGIEFQTVNADGSVARQQEQVDTAIAQQASAVLFGAVNGPQSGGMLNSLRAAGIPVINYASIALNGPIDYFVGGQYKDVGEAHGEYIAENLPDEKPLRLHKLWGDPQGDFYEQQIAGYDEHLAGLEADGSVKTVCKNDILAYDGAKAQQAVEQCLTKTDNGVDGIAGMNDSLLTAASAVLQQRGLEDQVTLYGGFDADLEAVKRILLGTQPQTLVIDYKKMARTAAEITVARLLGQEPPDGLINGTYNPKTGTSEGGDVPAAYLTNIVVNRENFEETVIGNDLYTKDEVCSGVAAKTEFCTGAG